MTDEKKDSSAFSDIYTELIKRLPLLDVHRQELKIKRGFNDDTISFLKFRSCSFKCAEQIKSLSVDFSTKELRESGIFINDDPNPKLLTDNILIPFLSDSEKIVCIKPHKSGLFGFRIIPYNPKKLNSFTIIAESEFKAAGAMQLGYSAVGLCGISSFSGKHFPVLCNLLKVQNVTSTCIIFDNEIKDNPAFPNYKKYFWERYDSEFYAFLMALKLEQMGIEATVAVLPDSWRKDGKIDIDGALAMGKTKEAFDPVIKGRKSPADYLKSLPKDAQILVQRLYQKAMAHFAVRVIGHKYFMPRGKGDDAVDVEVSNFTFKIENNFYNANGDCEREITLENDVGDRVTGAIFNGEELSHVVAFKRRCMNLGTFQFRGTAADMESIVAFETAREIGKKVVQPDHVGWVKEGNIYLFENAGITKNGERLPVDEDGIVWLGLKGFQAISLQQGTEDERSHIPKLWPEDVDPNALIDELEDNFGGFMGVRLACSWLIATLFSHELSLLYGNAFPMLFICGQQGSGKSTLARWISAMAGVVTEGANYWSGSLVGFQRSISYYSSQPLWLDEYRNSSENSMKAKEGFFRSSYDGQVSLKGLRTTFGVRGGAVRGRLILTGQDTPSDVALQQRCITIRLNSKGRTGEHYAELNAKAEKFSGIIPVLVKRWASRRAAAVKAVHTMREYLRSLDLDDRIAITYGIAFGAYDGLIKENDKKFFDFCVAHAKRSFAEKEAEKPAVMFLEDIQALKARGLVNGTMIRAVGGELAIFMKGIMPIWRQTLRSAGDDFAFKTASLLSEFEESDFCVARSKAVKIKGQSVRALILDPQKNEIVRAIYDATVSEEEA